MELALFGFRHYLSTGHNEHTPAYTHTLYRTNELFFIHHTIQSSVSKRRLLATVPGTVLLGLPAQRKYIRSSLLGYTGETLCRIQCLPKIKGLPFLSSKQSLSSPKSPLSARPTKGWLQSQSTFTYQNVHHLKPFRSSDVKTCHTSLLLSKI